MKVVAGKENRQGFGVSAAATETGRIESSVSGEARGR